MISGELFSIREEKVMITTRLEGVPHVAGAESLCFSCRKKPPGQGFSFSLASRAPIMRRNCYHTGKVLVVISHLRLNSVFGDQLVNMNRLRLTY